MLEQLIESNQNKNGTQTRAGYLLTSLAAVLALCSVTLAHSLYNYNLGLTNESLDASTLVAPVQIAEEAPRPPEQQTEPKQQNSAAAIDKLPVRAANIQRIDESPVKAPTDISTLKSSNLSRPLGSFKLGTMDSPGQSSNNRGDSTGGDSGNKSSGIESSLVSKNDDGDELPPVIKKAEVKAEPKKDFIKSGGVVNGKAVNLVKPAYPAPAKAVRAQGAVNVQVLIDEEGNVIKASAVSGHALLRQVAEQAARASKFSSTILTNQKVKVSGIIVYNFIAQ